MTDWLDTPQGRRLAYRRTPGHTGANFVWLTGFKSDIQGGKVTELEAWAKASGHGFLAFDYSDGDRRPQRGWRRRSGPT